MKKGINVLSLFGGIEGGAIILKEMGIEVENYFSSEVDKYPIMISSDNFPDIIHIGSVTEISYENGFLNWIDEYGEYQYYLTDIDLLIGGPPCQDLSIAGKRAGLTGEKSSLFWEYVRILNEVKPKAFFMENVASMPKEAMETITEALFGIQPMKINSTLTSAQTRNRLYWYGVLQDDGTYKGFEIPQPEDQGIVLKDILEDIPFDAVNEKGNLIWKPLPEKYINQVKDRTKAYALTATYANVCPRDYFEKSSRQIVLCNKNPSGKGMNGQVFSPEGKCPTLTTNKGEGIKIAQFRRGSSLRIHAEQEKVCTLTANMGTGGNNVPVILGQFQIPHGNNTGGLRDSGKAQCLNTSDYVNNNKIVAQEENAEIYWRALTVRECARAQNIPDWYSFDSVSKSRAYKGIGNGWELGAVGHIFSYLLEYIKPISVTFKYVNTTVKELSIK